MIWGKHERRRRSSVPNNAIDGWRLFLGAIGRYDRAFAAHETGWKVRLDQAVVNDPFSLAALASCIVNTSPDRPQISYKERSRIGVEIPTSL